MPVRRVLAWCWLLALLAMVGNLALATAALGPDHDHATAPTHACIICQIGHLPFLTSTLGITLRPPVPVAAAVVPPLAGHELDPSCITTSSRAPPA